MCLDPFFWDIYVFDSSVVDQNRPCVDPDPDPASHVYLDPDPAPEANRIRIRSDQHLAKNVHIILKSKLLS